MKNIFIHKVTFIICFSALLIANTRALGKQVKEADSIFHFVFISDSHFGLVKKEFRGKQNVPSNKVNSALVKVANQLPGVLLPNDAGVGANTPLKGFSFVVNGGDIANRMEKGVQSSDKSWKQFQEVYIKGLKLRTRSGAKSPLYYIPGNHDISNAIGHYKTLVPEKDPTAMVAIYNQMIHPATKITNETFDYAKHRVHYSFWHLGVHFQFLNMWPDSTELIWMQQDLDTVALQTPVVIITHDEPDVEPKHFTNPVPPYGFDASMKFENLLPEHYKGNLEQRTTDFAQNRFAEFVSKHPNIKAYFHGNYNWDEFYDYKNPANTISLPTFRVDSPMKGEKSANDESQLSFIVVSVNTHSKLLTARTCYYNQKNEKGKYRPKFGNVKTISLGN